MSRARRRPTNKRERGDAVLSRISSHASWARLVLGSPPKAAYCGDVERESVTV
jgi:hypothetical protein